jgi:hypothetical protein
MHMPDPLPDPWSGASQPAAHELVTLPAAARFVVLLDVFDIPKNSGVDL